MPGVSNDVQALARLLCGRGWRVTRTRRGHLRWRAPDGGVTVTGSRLSEPRTIHNIRARLRALGALI